jgi:autotransporter translocation and assembly factor TamB
VDARLAFRGTPDASRLEGDVTLRDGLYYRDVDLDPLQAVTAAPRTSAEPAEADTVPFLSNVELDVDVNSRNELRVENNLAELRLRPDLSVSGTLHDPGLRGRASVTSGTVTYRRTTFKVTKGVVDFVNPYEIDPRLDIRAESSVRSWDIVLTIKGPLDKLKLSLSSKQGARGTASLEQSDIISLLLTGRTTGELAEGGLGGQQSPRQMVAELVGTTVGDDLRRAAGLDILEITTGEEGDTTSSDRIGVTVGKRITRRLSTRLSMESEDNELLRKATVIYKLSERVQLKSFNTTRGEYGGEVEYQIEFR